MNIKVTFQIISFALIFSLLACGQTNNQAAPGGSAENPDIHITVQNPPATGSAYLVGVEAERQFIIDSALIDAKGMIHFKRTTPYPQGLVYCVVGNANFPLLIAEDQTFSMTTAAPDFIGTMEVKDNRESELLYENLRFEIAQQPALQSVNQRLKGLAKTDPAYATTKAEQEKLMADLKTHLTELYARRAGTFFEKYKRAGQNPEIREIKNADGTPNNDAQVFLFKQDMWDLVDFNDPRLLSTPIIPAKLRTYLFDLTYQRSDSLIAATDQLMRRVMDKPKYYQFFVNFIGVNFDPTNSTLMDAENVYVHVLQNYFTKEKATWADSMTIYGLQLRAYEMQASLVGRKGPDVTINDITGKPRSLYDIKAPYIIIFMYRPDCEHCIEETPKLVQFYKKWNPQGVEVFAIAMDTQEALWKDFVQKNKMNWINVFDPSNKSIYAKYFVDDTPEIYILNKDRTIIGKNLKVEQIETILQRDKQGLN